jgi:adenylate cyclase
MSEFDPLLEGLSGDERAARERLLQQLSNDGFSVEELQRAVAEDRLALLPVERVLGARYTAKEIEERTGLPAQLMLRVRRLGGLPEASPDDRVFGDEDVEAARSARLFLEAGMSEEAISEITRVLGEGMARFAASVAATFAEQFLEAGDTEEQVGERFAALAEHLTPAVAPVLIASFNAHLRETVRRAMIGREERAAGALADFQQITVCFADLVGFTRLGGEVEVQELGSVAGQLADLAGDVTAAPVRLVKTIGDAAMFVSPEPGQLVGVALSLVEAIEAADLPSLRAGIAVGEAQLRAGDYFGHSVNLASRVTGVARPGSVLCTEQVRDAAADEFDWSFAGRHRLKGLADRVPLYRARRLPTKPPGDRRRKRGSR